MAERDKEVERLAARLDAMSPLKVLARGYAIATREDGRAVRDAGDVSPGQSISLRVQRARIGTLVTSVDASPDGTSPVPPERGQHLDGTSPAPPERGQHLDGTSPAPPERGQHLDDVTSVKPTIASNPRPKRP
jgi:exodeoxyribonuclease VII large subunit